MKKSFFTLCVFLFSAALISAQTSIDSVFSSLMSQKVTAGDFVQEKNAAKLKRPLKSSGKFIFCEDGILWQTLKPFPSTMAVTKTSIIQTKPDGTKTVTDGSSNEVFKSVAETVSSLFSGDRAKLEAFFNFEKFEADSSKWQLLLSPKDSTISSALKQIELSGTTGSAPDGKSTLDSLKIIQSETESTSYTLLNQQYRQELTDAEKAFFK